MLREMSEDFLVGGRWKAAVSLEKLQHADAFMRVQNALCIPLNCRYIGKCHTQMAPARPLVEGINSN